VSGPDLSDQEEGTVSKREKGTGLGGSSLGICLALTVACLALLAPTAAQAVPPTIVKTGVSGVTTTTARLEATINPNGRATAYRFEYGPDACASNPCASLPAPEGKIPTGSEPVSVSVVIEGLSPGASRHFRVIAKSSGAGGGETISPDRVFATYLEPQAFGACPNDLLRTENPAAARIERSSALLPDCRAYERASPLDKNAGDVTGTVPLTRAGASGGTITFVSSTGVPGGVGSQEFPAYLASRGAAGWTTAGLLPPAEAGQNALVLGWTPDFEEVFSKATRFGEPNGTTFLMTPLGQVPVQVADYAPAMNPAFAGASDGAAAVLFESSVALPGVTGAIAGKPNLYLWERAGNRLLLAGILNDEEAPAKGAFAGPYDWAVGANPTSLGRGGAEATYYTQEEHALSADGSAVYFTAAGSGQLYVRLNPAAEQSAVDGGGNCLEPDKACTLHVSASQKTNGPGGGPDPAGPRPAAFMAASEDGSKAFFTSPEMLTDDANTGPEQEPAAIQRADVATGENVDGSCIPTHALGLAVDSEHLYWTDPNGSIGRADLDCGEPEEGFIEAGPGVPQFVAVDDEYVYWTSKPADEVLNQFPQATGGSIGRALKSGDGDPEPDFITGLSAPQGIAVDANYIYWSNVNDNHDSIGRADINGEHVNLLFFDLGPTTELRGIAVSPSHIYWISETISGDNVLVTLHRLDVNGDPLSHKRVGVDDHAKARGLAIDAGHLYWGAADAIGRANLDLEERELEWIEEASHPFGVAVNGADVFWSSNGEADPNPGNDLYLYEGGALSDLSVDGSSEAGADVQGILGASEDGAYVYYAANGVPDGTLNSPNARGEAAAPGDCNRLIDGASGSCNLYLWHEDPATHARSTTFIARLDRDGGERSDATNWAPKTGGLSADTNFQKTARLSPDGRTLLFRSQRRLTAYDNEGVAQFYRYRAGAAGLACVSCNPTGTAPAGDPRLGSIFPTVAAPTSPSSLVARNLSADGNRVFFESLDPLVGEDTNGQGGCPKTGSLLQRFPSCLDVYEWEAEGFGGCTAARAVAQGGCLYLLSTGRGADPALIADASADGDDVFLFTRSRLVGEDADQLRDVYDARVDGGLAAQNAPLPPPPCEGETSCRTAATPPLPGSSPGSAAFIGPGDPPRAHKPRCPKGKRAVKRHGKWRCVKKHRRGRQTHHRGRPGAEKGRAGR
jgi:WD40-like Beta Propeller Repeat